MSIKSTQRITRAHALDLPIREAVQLRNDTLGNVLDYIADTEQGKILSRFDNFIVSDVGEEDITHPRIRG